ncbi:hypothetical protein [Mucilaginibacter sp.]|uniref:hypothetical protein n=1 Tax=Mucilaginibacter sp. TaxID=1882438 RepID=UPI0032640B26
MKKLTAIFLLAILLFNIGGHLLFHQYFTYRCDKFFSQQVAQNRYNLHDLTEVKIPVNLPNLGDDAEYQDVTGQINFESSSYNYVKMKLTKTAMYLLCVPNYETTRLSGQNIIEARGMKDIPVPKKNHVPFGKLVLIVYSHQNLQYRFATPIITTFKKIHLYTQLQISNSSIEGPGQPPDGRSILS